MYDLEGVRSLDLARRLRNAGICIHIEEDDNPSPYPEADGLLIHQFGNQWENCAFDLSPVGAGFVITISITRNVRGPFSIDFFAR